MTPKTKAHGFVIRRIWDGKQSVSRNLKLKLFECASSAWRAFNGNRKPSDADMESIKENGWYVEPTCLLPPSTIDKVREFVEAMRKRDLNQSEIYYAAELLKLLPEVE